VRRKILIMGLPGAGKTTLALALLRRINAVHFNADAVRREISRDLGFSVEDRVEHARRMGWLCDRVVEAGGYAVADFICPTEEARAAFQADRPAFVIWVDRIAAGRFEDTNRVFVPPEAFDLRVAAEGSVEFWSERAAAKLRPLFDWNRPTALCVGRYQPFHGGHRALIEEGLHRVGQVCIAVRATAGIDENNPFSFEHARARIEHALRTHEGRFTVVLLPNLTHIFYGRDVGYAIERIDLDIGLQAISATQQRRLLRDGIEQVLAPPQPA
jgi:adenylylsulfate kinase